jgi:hypothetical protein
LKKVEVLTSLQAQSRKIETFFNYGYTYPVAINSFHLACNSEYHKQLHGSYALRWSAYGKDPIRDSFWY